MQCLYVYIFNYLYNKSTWSRILSGLYLYSLLKDILIDDVVNIFLVSLLHKRDILHVSLRLLGNRSQKRLKML